MALPGSALFNIASGLTIGMASRTLPCFSHTCSYAFDSRLVPSISEWVDLNPGRSWKDFAAAVRRDLQRVEKASTRFPAQQLRKAVVMARLEKLLTRRTVYESLQAKLSKRTTEIVGKLVDTRLIGSESERTVVGLVEQVICKRKRTVEDEGEDEVDGDDESDGKTQHAAPKAPDTPQPLPPRDGPFMPMGTPKLPFGLVDELEVIPSSRSSESSDVAVDAEAKEVVEKRLLNAILAHKKETDPWIFDGGDGNKINMQHALRRMQKKLLQAIQACKLDVKINTAAHLISRSIVVLTESRPAECDDFFTDEEWMALRRRFHGRRLKTDDALWTTLHTEAKDLLNAKSNGMGYYAKAGLQTA
ncbi:hypothetical protein HDU86_008331 [Geranomyces michiganensis]|nr:hypothetical protein HDU86_008331 [Geranomyces michiganensis]